MATVVHTILEKWMHTIGNSYRCSLRNFPSHCCLMEGKPFHLVSIYCSCSKLCTVMPRTLWIKPSIFDLTITPSVPNKSLPNPRLLKFGGKSILILGQIPKYFIPTSTRSSRNQNQYVLHETLWLDVTPFVENVASFSKALSPFSSMNTT